MWVDELRAAMLADTFSKNILKSIIIKSCYTILVVVIPTVFTFQNIIGYIRIFLKKQT